MGVRPATAGRLALGEEPHELIVGEPVLTREVALDRHREVHGPSGRGRSGVGPDEADVGGEARHPVRRSSLHAFHRGHRNSNRGQGGSIPLTVPVPRAYDPARASTIFVRFRGDAMKRWGWLLVLA